MNKDYDILHGSKRLEQVPVSGIRAIMTKAKKLSNEGKDVISFSAGEPDFNTPESIKEATIQALRENYTHYALNWGENELRREIAKKTYRETGVSYNPETEILVTCGGCEGINNIIYSTVDPEDEIIIFKPAFVNYDALVKAVGAKIVDINLLPENDFQIDLQEVRNKITEKTKMMIINSPNNPTGIVFKKELLAGLAELAKEHNLLVFSDEIYNNLTYENAEFCSMASFPGMKERTLILNGFSKAYAMTGWRMGYVAGPEELMPKLLKNHQYTTTCIPTFLQIGVARSMNQEATLEDMDKMKKALEKRRELILKGLSGIPNISCIKPYGAFYIMIDVKKTGLTGEVFAERLLYEKYVATVPAICFGEHYGNYVRISYANSEENIIKGLERIKEFAENL